MNVLQFCTTKAHRQDTEDSQKAGEVVGSKASSHAAVRRHVYFRSKDKGKKTATRLGLTETASNEKPN